MLLFLFEECGYFLLTKLKYLLLLIMMLSWHFVICNSIFWKYFLLKSLSQRRVTGLKSSTNKFPVDMEKISKSKTSKIEAAFVSFFRFIPFHSSWNGLQYPPIGFICSYSHSCFSKKMHFMETNQAKRSSYFKGKLWIWIFNINVLGPTSGRNKNDIIRHVLLHKN